MPKRISHCQGKGSLTHNNREFHFKNVDPERTPDNITYVKQSLGEAYEYCFGEAVRRYNEKQSRADRRIDNYYAYLFGKAPQTSVATSANKQKSFYETLVQIGTMGDSGVGTADGELAARCLDEYIRGSKESGTEIEVGGLEIKGFSERNPNFYVFNAVLHMDEATPHLHIDYIPIGHYKRGMDTQNGIAQALKEMGYGGGKDAISRWRVAERKILEDICRKNGVDIAEPKKARGYSLAPDDYKVQVDEEKAGLQKDIEGLRNKARELQETYKSQANDLRKVCEDLQLEISHLEDVKKQTAAETSETQFKASELRDVVNDLEGKRKALEGQINALEGKIKAKQGIDKLPIKITRPIFGKEDSVTMTKSDYDSLVKTALASPRVETAEKLKQAEEKISELEAVVGKVKSLEKTVGNLKQEISNLKQNIDSKDDAIEKQRLNIQGIRQVNDRNARDLRSKISRLEKEKGEVIERVNKVLGKIDSQAANLFIKEWEAEGLRLKRQREDDWGPSL